MKKDQNRKDSSTLPDEEYERLGRMLQNLYETGYMNRKRLYKMSFLKGVLTGLGGVIGATIVVSLLLWLLSVLNFTPLRPVTEKLQETVQPQQ